MTHVRTEITFFSGEKKKEKQPQCQGWRMTKAHTPNSLISPLPFCKYLRKGQHLLQIIQIMKNSRTPSSCSQQHMVVNTSRQHFQNLEVSCIVKAVLPHKLYHSTWCMHIILNCSVPKMYTIPIHTSFPVLIPFWPFLQQCNYTSLLRCWTVMFKFTW